MNTIHPTIITFNDDSFFLKPAVGIAPLGYKKAFIDNDIVVLPDEVTAPNVVLAFELASRGKSFREMLKILKERGLVSSRGNALSLSSLHNMLTNPFYTGDLRADNKLWHNDHQPLISKSLFGRVQRNLLLRSKTKPLRDKPVQICN